MRRESLSVPVDDDATQTSSSSVAAVGRNTDFRSPGGGSVHAPLRVNRHAYHQEKFDREFGWIGPSELAQPLYKNVRSKLKCTGAWWWRMVVGFFPIIDWLPKYSVKRDLAPDIIAGLTVGIMHIPQGMAYADLAGLDPVYGLYTSFFPSIFYMFFGTSKHVSLGVFAVVSLMVGQVRLRVLPDDVIAARLAGNLSLATSPVDWSDPITQLSAIEVVTCLTMAVGFVQLLMGLLRLGFITAYLSDQVISGFTTGAACHVFTAQINKVMNVKLPRFSGLLGIFKTYFALINDVPNASYLSIGVSLLTMLICVLGKEFINPPFKRRFSVPIPWELIVVVLGTIVSHYCHFNEMFELAIVDNIPVGLPMPRLPPMYIMPALISDAISIAIVVFVVTISLGKLFAKKHHYRIDPDQECFALGFMQLLSCWFDVFPASTALARSLVYEAAGVRTQLATIWTCGLLFVVLMWIGPLFSDLPMCVLASIILVALKGMFMQLKQLPDLWRVSRIDFVIWVVAFVATVMLDVRNGLIVGIVFALLTSIFRSQRPPAVTLGRLPQTEIYRDVKRYKKIEMTPSIAVYRFDSPLMFTNAERFKDQLYVQSGIDLAAARKRLDQQLAAADAKRRQLDSPDTPTTTREQRAPLRPSHIVNGGTVGRTDSTTTLEEPDEHPVSGLLYLPDYVVLDCSGFNYVDYMGVQTLKEVYSELTEIGVTLLYAHLKGPCRDIMEAANFYSHVPKTCIFPTVHCAVTFAEAARRGAGALVGSDSQSELYFDTSDTVA